VVVGPAAPLERLEVNTAFLTRYTLSAVSHQPPARNFHAIFIQWDLLEPELASFGVNTAPAYTSAPFQQILCMNTKSL